ncbi:MAG: AmmeMemoRadiSam system protein A [Myxococcota bacterium]
MSSAERTEDRSALSGPERARLLEIAGASIDSGLERGHALELEVGRESELLRRPGACFVTLRRDRELRGCIGSLEPSRPLARDVAENAYRAAFHDPRFPPLGGSERAGLDVHLAILGPRSPIAAASEAELLSALRPGVDGLVVCEGPRRATFLPAVWQSLSSPRDFVRELKRKAGLAADHWSTDLRFERYETESIPRVVGEPSASG